MRKQFILFLSFLFVITSLSQSKYGLPAYRTIKPDEYKSHPQIWEMLQLKNNKVMLCTYQDVLMYNGNKFRKINKTFISVRAALEDTLVEKIYVGGDVSFGYFKKDSIGEYNYINLSNKLPDKLKNFVVILGVEKLNNKYYFFGLNRIFIYNNNDSLLKVIPANTSFRYSFKIKNRIFTFEMGGGLAEVVNDSIKIIPETKEFKNGRIYGIAMLNDSIALLSAKPGGIYKWNIESASIKKIKTSADDYFKTFDAKTIKIFKNGNIGVGTGGGGLVVLNKDFTTSFIFNTTNGLPDDEVYAFFEDKNSNIWVSTNNGFSILYNYSNINYINLDENGIKNIPIGGEIKDSTYYLATLGGLYKFTMTNIPNEDNHFLNLKPDKNNPVIRNQFLDIIKADNGDILLTGSNSLIILRNDKPILNLNGYLTSVVAKSRIYENTFYVPYTKGLITLHNVDNKWEYDKINLNFKSQTRFVYEQDSLNLYVSTINTSLMHIKYKDTSSKEYTSKEINLLPFNNKNIPVLFILNDTLFSFSYGIDSVKTYFFDAKKDTMLEWHYKVKFLNNSNSNDLPGYNVDYTIYPDSLMFFRCNYNLTSLYLKNDTFFINSYPFRDMKKAGITALVYDKKTKLFWGATTDYIFNIKPNSDINIKHNNFRAYIDNFVLINDSIISYNNENPLTVLPYKYNGFTIYFSAPFFNRNDKVKFKYFLEGFDKKWSKLTETHFTKYTNLPPGNYTFRVKALNIFKDESTEASYHFTILPPWYITWWAYIIYITILILLVIFVAKIYSKKLKADNEKLERIVEKRTEKITEQHNLIKQSINYAKKIQEAMLPSEEQLKSAFQNSFMIYKPRDIVSGDFVWMHKITENQYIIALADCTGHGVPGAFMSMIGNTLLNEIVKVHKKYSPAEILNDLHKGVKNSLHKSNKESLSFDGIDIAVLKINTETKQLTVSTANQYAFVFLDDKFSFIQGDLLSIGDPLAFQNKINFTETNLYYNNSLQIFLSTDGYFDQFGGPNNKKYGINKFIETLNKIHKLKADKQREILTYEFENWKKNYRQIDDILVVGVNL